ncbi:MAG: PAS domain S-box protein, partial [Melioribacteraceae bacterium]
MNTEGRTILLVEDDELLALTESRWLKKVGYKLLHAPTGEKAVSIAGDPNQKIDLILMDINLGPGIDGTDAARAILRKNDIPVLFLSSHTEKEVVEKTEEITSYGYVVKDSKDVVLLASIKMAFKLHDANKKLSKNEEALQESEAKFRSIFEQAPVGMLLLSPSGEFLNVNKSLCELFGYSEEQLLKMTFKDLTYPDDIEESGAWIERLINNEAASVDFEKRYVTKSGATIHAIVRTILRRNAEGLPLYFISHIQDITERKRAESEIISKNRDLAALLNTSQALASTLEMQTILQIIIEKAIELIGLDTGAIYLLNDLGLYLGATTPPLPEDFPEIFRHTQLIDHPNIAKAITVQNPIVISDISKGEFSPAEKIIVEGRGLGSILYLPIFLGKEAVGILLLGTVNRSRSYSDSEIDSYRTMAYQAALTIDNARLYRKVQNQIREPKFDLEQYLIKDIALQSSLSAIGLADMDGNLIYANDSYYSMWECRPEEVIGKNLSETAKFEGREMLEEVMNSILNGGGYFGECPAYKKDGTPFYVQMAANIVTSPAGDRICMMASFIDITERKIVQEQLRGSEAKFRLFFESNSAAMAIIDPDTTISLVNNAYCRMSGYSKEEAIGKSWTEQIPAKDLERLMEYNRKRLINPEDAPDKYEFTFYHKSGDIKNGLMSIGMIPGEKKIIASFTDITEQKQTEKELESSLSVLETTLESTIDGILVVNENGEITRYNKKFVEQWRIPEEILATGDDEKAIEFVLDQLKNPKKFVSKVNELYERPLEVSFDVLEFKDGRVFERYSQPQL